MTQSIQNIWAIARKDLRGYFASPIAYLVMAVFSAIMGYMFFSLLNLFVLQGMQFEQMRYGHGPNLTEGLVRPLFGNMNVVLLFIVPFITMRLFAEEKKNNTIELLFTAPVKMSEIVLGKYFSALLFVLVLLLLTLPYPIALAIATKPDWGVLSMSYLGTVFMIGTYVAMGILCSSITENQIVAGALTFGTILFFWIIKWASYSTGAFWSDLLSYLSIVDHFEDFSRGVLASKDVVFFCSAIALWLFLTYKALESYTWRS